MRKAIKKEGKRIQAYQLGADSEQIAGLLAEGKIKKCSGGKYEVFSREAVNGKGEVARDGDYIKMDSEGFPYPNSKDFFEENHRMIQEGIYEQIPRPVDIWTAEEPICDEIEFLQKEKGLILDETDIKAYFNAPLWGSMLSAARNAVLVFYRIDREGGRIVDADFNFVEQTEFGKAYRYL